MVLRSRRAAYRLFGRFTRWARVVAEAIPSPVGGGDGGKLVEGA
jgi:hypothetical protein